MRKRHWVVKLGLTLGLLVLADYDIGAIMHIAKTQYVAGPCTVSTQNSSNGWCSD